jgi:8-oxo-dGTP pyrophosphatase MutT (NUDIX family)
VSGREPPARRELARVLGALHPGSDEEAADLARLAALVAAAEAAGGPSPWDRGRPLHLTASALVLHPPSGRVLLRWHERLAGWRQVGGHGDPGEDDPLAIARREAREETGLGDLEPWPRGRGELPVHVTVVPVPAAGGEPAHEHGDLRYLLATAHPGAARPERPGAPLRWATLDEAVALVGDDGVAATLGRAADLLNLEGG